MINRLRAWWSTPAYNRAQGPNTGYWMMRFIVIFGAILFVYFASMDFVCFFLQFSCPLALTALILAL